MTLISDYINHIPKYYPNQETHDLTRIKKISFYARHILELRTAFLGKVLESSVWIVYHLAVAVFQTLRALTVGLAFTNSVIRETLVRSWKNFGTTARGFSFALTGILTPHGAKFLINKYN